MGRVDIGSKIAQDMIGLLNETDFGSKLRSNSRDSEDFLRKVGMKMN